MIHELNFFKIGLHISTLFIIYSIISNFYFVYHKKIKYHLYLSIYLEYLIMMGVLFILFNILNYNPYYSIIIIALTDFSIQSVLQYGRLEGLNISRRMGCIKHKREFFSPFALEVYYFENLKCHIFDIESKSPLREYLIFGDFMNFKKNKKRIKHQFGDEKVFSFEIIYNKKIKKNNSDESGFIEDKKILNRLNRLYPNAPIKTAFYTGAYYTGDRLRITIDKEFCKKEPHKIIQILESQIINK